MARVCQDVCIANSLLKYCNGIAIFKLLLKTTWWGTRLNWFGCAPVCPSVPCLGYATVNSVALYCCMYLSMHSPQHPVTAKILQLQHDHPSLLCSMQYHIPITKHDKLIITSEHYTYTITHKTIIMVSLVMTKQFIWTLPSNAGLLAPNRYTKNIIISIMMFKV